MHLTLRGARREYRRQRREWLPVAASLLLALSTVFLLVAFTSHNRGTSLRTSVHADEPLSLLSKVSVRAAGYKDDFCDGPNPTNHLKSTNRIWLVLLLPLIVFLFIGLAIVTDDFFVPSLERICEQLSLSDDVAGATFMAAGSSAPELFTSLMGALWTRDDVGIGTIVGSAVFNILIIIGLSGALAGSKLSLDPRPLLRDSMFYITSIVLLILFVMFIGGSDGVVAGRVMWWEGLILIIVYVVYILFMKFLNKPYMNWLKRFAPKKPEEELTGLGPVLENGTAHAPEHAVTSAAPEHTVTSAAPEHAITSAAPEPASPADATKPDDMSATAIATAPDVQTGTEDAHRVGAAAHVPEQSSLEPEGTRYSKLNARSHFRVLTYAVMAANSLTVANDVSEIADVEPDAPSAVGIEPAPRVRNLIPGVPMPTSKFGWLALPLTAPWHFLYRFSIIDCSKDERAKWWPLTFSLSILWIMAISFIMVEATRLSGCYIGIHSAVMGITFLAAGTSVPDALASIAVARNGYGNMAVSNAIGSNVFDILLALGLPWFIAGFMFGHTSITVEPITLIVVPIAILFIIIIVLVLLLIRLKWQLTRKLGYILFGLYGCFIVYSLLDALVFNKEKPGK